MLQAIREKAQGWIAWVIVILISIPFALWGIQEYLGVGSEPEVAVINGDPVTQRMLDERTRDFRENMRYSLGENYRAELFDDATLKPQVLEAMVEEKVLLDTVADLNLRTSDAQARAFIGSIAAFQRDGQFDQQVYDATVRNRGLSRASFEQSVRQDLAMGQLRNGVRESAFVTERGLAERVRLREEKRSITFARVPASAYLDQVDVTVEALRGFYDENLDRYRTPERVKLAYLALDAVALGRFVEVSEEALKRYFEDHRTQFVAREERAMRHILVAVPAGADEATTAEARAKAEGLLAELRAGGDFVALAKENSDDPGSADNGGDLGWVERGLMVPPFEEAAFALPQSEISELVQTDFGFHIIEVTDIRGGSDAGFEELRDQVDAAYRKFEAENLYFEYAERLAEAAYENAASLVPAAEALGLTVRTTDWLTREDALPDELNSPKVVNAAFSEDVLGSGNNSELIEVAPQRSVVVRVAEHEPAGVLPFEDNRLAIEKDFRSRQASEQAAATGKALIAELQQGAKTGLQQVASDHAWELVQPGTVGRQQADVPAEVLAKAFDLPPPEQANARYAGVTSADGDYLLIEVAAVVGGSLDALAVAERPLLAEQVAGQLALEQMRYLTNSLRQRAEIVVKPLAE